MAQRSDVVDLEWQLPEQWADTRKSPIRFRAQQNNHHSQEGRSFNGEVTVTGRVGQQFVVCAGDLSSDDFTQTSVVAETSHLHTLTLTKNAGVLSINNEEACPEWLTPQYPYNMAQRILSTEPFIATRKNEPRNHPRNEERQLSALPSNPFEPQESALVTLTGGGSGFDDHEDFKRPPFMPMPDKAMANLILLPALNLPDNWRDYLPFVGLYHWLTNQPEEHAGLTLLVRFDGQPPIILPINQAEYSTMAEHLLSARQLLRWLAHKLNGRESMIRWLLDYLENYSEDSFEEKVANSIRQQLQIVLEQPDTEFSLSFEVDQLGSILNSNKHDTMGIVQLPEGKTDQQSATLPPDTPTDNSGISASPDSNQPNENRNSPPPREGADQPPNSRTPSGAGFSHELTQNHFLLNVNGHVFRVDKHQLSPDKRGSEDPASITARSQNIPGLSLPLNEIEETAGIPATQQLARDSDSLDYLVKYGTETTKWLLLDFYPVSILAHSDQQLVIDKQAVIPQTDLECPVCLGSILKQANLVKVDCSDLLHSRCFMEYLRQSPAEVNPVRCPICFRDIPELSRLLGHQRTLEQRIMDAASEGNTALVSTLLMLGVNVDVITQGQAPPPQGGRSRSL